MRCAGRLGLQSRFDQLGNTSGIVVWLAATARCDLPHAADALLADTTAPQRHGASVNPELGGRRLHGLTGGRIGDDPRSQHDLLWCRPRANPLRETKLLLFRQKHRRTRT